MTADSRPSADQTSYSTTVWWRTQLSANLRARSHRREWTGLRYYPVTARSASKRERQRFDESVDDPAGGQA